MSEKPQIYRASGFHHDPLTDISNLRQTLKGYEAQTGTNIFAVQQTVQ